MQEKTYPRKKKEERPVIAICYDFDKTLSPTDMQDQGFIQAVGYETADFWRESNSLADDHDMDRNLAYMLRMLDSARQRGLPFTRESLMEWGSKIRLFPGVEEWFDRIRAYGREQGVLVEHYIISSGLKEMIEGTAIAGFFEKIYASSFYFDETGTPLWPAQVVNYTNKTQFLFRIRKGVLELNDPGVNDVFAPEEIRVPFCNMIYIGDSDTDIPCMRLVHSYGGHSVGVYSTETLDRTKVHKMLQDDRIGFDAPTDYTENSPLDLLVKDIICRAARAPEGDAEGVESFPVEKQLKLW